MYSVMHRELSQRMNHLLKCNSGSIRSCRRVALFYWYHNYTTCFRGTWQSSSHVSGDSPDVCEILRCAQDDRQRAVILSAAKDLRGQYVQAKTTPSLPVDGDEGRPQGSPLVPSSTRVPTTARLLSPRPSPGSDLRRRVTGRSSLPASYRRAVWPRKV